jgi:hypothetical protein
LSRNKIGLRSNDEQTEIRLKRWISTVGTVTLPLLAGFSITAVVVVSQDPNDFLCPGATVLVVAFAAMVLIVAVQCAYHAHVYLSNIDPDRKKGITYAKWTRRFYDAGLLTLLVDLALIVAPHRGTGIQVDLRWAAVALVCVAFAGESIWLLVDPWLRSRNLREVWPRARLVTSAPSFDLVVFEEFLSFESPVGRTADGVRAVSIHTELGVYYATLGRPGRPNRSVS